MDSISTMVQVIERLKALEVKMDDHQDKESLVWQNAGEKLDDIKVQTIKHNGRLSRLERAMLIIGAVSATLLMTNAPEVVAFVASII